MTIPTPDRGAAGVARSFDPRPMLEILQEPATAPATMDRYHAYKVLHIYGIALLFAALGGLNLVVANSITKDRNAVRRFVPIAHGLGAFLILLGGFGMLARLGLVSGHAFPGWLWAKIAIWVLLAVVVAVPYRKPALARPLFWITPLFALLAAWIAIYKPF